MLAKQPLRKPGKLPNKRMFDVVLQVIGVVLLVVVVLLALPLTVRFQISRQQTFQGWIAARWAFGLVHIRLPLPVSGHTAPRSGRVQRKRPRQKPSSRKPLALVRNGKFRRRIFRFASDLWRAFRKRDVSIYIRLGLGDPADTGQLWAIMGPLAGLLANVRQARLELVPEFSDAVFELDSRGTITVIPLQIVCLGLLLFLSPAIWQGIIQTRQAG